MLESLSPYSLQLHGKRDLSFSNSFKDINLVKLIYHFLQAIDEIAYNNTETFELLDHVGDFLTGTLAHVRCHFLLLPNEIGGDGRTDRHSLRTFINQVNFL